MASQAQYSTAEAWLKARIGNVPSTSTGWFRAGVGFYNKREYAFAIQCFEKAIALDPQNYNAYQVMSRACIAVNRTFLLSTVPFCPALSLRSLEHLPSSPP
jgi:tetratricopeptide (TPR) repeat protein